MCATAVACCLAADLADDPYRSLAALVRKAGGFQKSTQPFSEVRLLLGEAPRSAPRRRPLPHCAAAAALPQFVWANHLRARVPMALVAVGDETGYIDAAVSHATHPDAAALPGYCPLTPAAAVAGEAEPDARLAD